MNINGTSRIVKTPETCWGRARIDCTRITVKYIVTLYKLGVTPQGMITQMPHLTIADVEAALAYYGTHQAEIDQEIAAGEQLEETLRREMPSLLQQKLAARHAGTDTLPPG